MAPMCRDGSPAEMWGFLLVREVLRHLMPYAPWPLCIIPGCPNRTRSGRCEEHRLQHAKQQDQRRPNATARGYDHHWQKTRLEYLAAHPLCESDQCTALPEWRHPRATDVDHIDGSGPRGNNDWANLQALCHACHSRKTATHDGGFGHHDN